jgi:CheY-like chemotaxis protein
LLLVVEDDPAVLYAMSLFLEACDFEVRTASEGTQALDRLEVGGRLPDLVISDYRLPGGMTGADVIRQLRSAAGIELPAILMTGDTSADRLREAEALGCHLVHKPAGEDDLLPLIRELVG